MISAVPVGAVVVTCCAVLAVVPIARPRWLGTVSWIAGNFPNELPFAYALVVVVPNLLGLLGGDLTTRGQVTAVLTVVVVAALAVIVARGLRARQIVRRALDDGLGDRHGRVRLPRRRRWFRILFVPWPVRPRTVVRTADVAYGPGPEQRLDVYRHRSLPAGLPTLVHLHGGHFRWGRRSREARALLFRLADLGWTCISADYHLSRTPAEGHPDHLVDVKRLLAWARSDGGAHGIAPDAIVLAGSSAGAHLTAMAALTAGDTSLQPGFEDADTSIAAGIGLGGYYGGLDGDDSSPSSPLARHAPAPPFFVVHGDRDTATPPAGARRLVAHLRSQPGAVVPYAELPGGQHAFDLFSSLRFEAVVDGIEAFTGWLFAGTPASGRRLRGG